jgi:hypothetical protein
MPVNAKRKRSRWRELLCSYCLALYPDEPIPLLRVVAVDWCIKLHGPERFLAVYGERKGKRHQK